MIEIPMTGDQVAYVDEQTAALLGRYRIAFNHAVIDGDLLPEPDFNRLACDVLVDLKVLEIPDEGGEGGTDRYCLRPGAKLTTGVFKTLCDLLEGRVCAIKEGDVFFLSLPFHIWERLERRIYRSHR